MSEELNPLAESLLEGFDLPDGEIEMESEKPYGIGRYKNSVLIEVSTLEHTEGFPYQAELVFNLKGDSMRWTGRLNLPRALELNGNAEENKWREDRNQKDLRRYGSILKLGHAIPQAGKTPFLVNDDKGYELAIGLLKSCVGAVIPIRVREQVKPDGQGGFRPTGFTIFELI